MNRLVFIFLPLLLCSLAVAQEAGVTACLDSTEYKIGSWVLLHVEARFPQSVDSLIPAVRDSLGPFEILAVESHGPTEGRQQWVFRLTAFDTGGVFIPPIPFLYRSRPDTAVRVARSNPLPVSIVGIPIDPKGDIKDIKPPLDAPWRFEDFLPYIIALLLLTLIATGYYYYQKRKRQRELANIPPKPTIPPGQAALAALRILEDKHLWQQGKVKAYYSEVTEIVRRFFEDQHGLAALESTSDEILSQLKLVPEAASFIPQCRSFFTTADLVKFAKYLPTPSEHDQELGWAYEIVRALIPRYAEELEEQEVESVR
jgi:hypothetical protein